MLLLSVLLVLTAFAVAYSEKLDGDDDAVLSTLSSGSGFSIDHLQRVRQILSSRAEPNVVNSDATDLEERIDQITFNNRGYKAAPPSIADLNEPLSSRSKRFAPIKRIWDSSKPIPYRFEASMLEPGKIGVRKAFDIISNLTCLAFVEKPSADSGISFNGLGLGCFSNLGKPDEGWQHVNLQAGCELSMKTLLHELMHALGSLHEQQRTDRDKYIDVNMKVVNTNRTQDFLTFPYENDNLGIPYDYGSIMQYNAYSGTLSGITGPPSMVPKDIMYTETMGSAHFFSFNDLKSLNKLYKCNDKCPSPLSCQNGGYVHPKDCSKCVCTDFHKGPLCETTISSLDIALGVTHNFTHMTKPNNGADFKGWERDWAEYDKMTPLVISAPAGRHLNVTIVFNGGSRPCVPTCPYDGLEFVEGDDLTRAGKLFCCYDEGKSFITNTNIIGIKAYNVPGSQWISYAFITAV